jgi:hypothetical protein
LAHESNAAVVVAAHFAKGNAALKDALDRIVGSGVMARDPDAMLLLTPHAEPDAHTVSFILRDHKERPEFVVKWQYPLMEREFSLDPKNLKKSDMNRPNCATKDDVFSVLDPGDEVTKDEIIERVRKRTGCSQAAASKAFRDAEFDVIHKVNSRFRSGTSPLKLYGLCKDRDMKPETNPGPDPE